MGLRDWIIGKEIKNKNVNIKINVDIEIFKNRESEVAKQVMNMLNKARLQELERKLDKDL